MVGGTGVTTPVHFGTDGWRAVIAEDFTFDNVRDRRARQQPTTCDAPDRAARGVVVGYDTRFLSGTVRRSGGRGAGGERHPSRADLVARARRRRCRIAVLDRGAGGGVIITASHNPARWNGFKVKMEYGGSRPPEVTQAIEAGDPRRDRRRARAAACRSARPRRAASSRRSTRARRTSRRCGSSWTSRRSATRAARARGLDVRRGGRADRGAARRRRDAGGGDCTASATRRFPGIRAPEPIAPNLGESARAAAQPAGYDVGLSTDGDADRLGVVDEHGRFITQLQDFALLAHYLLERARRARAARALGDDDDAWWTGSARCTAARCTRRRSASSTSARR